MSYGPPTAQGRALIIITLVLLPLVFVFYSFVTAERGLLTHNLFRDNPRSPDSVQTKVVTTIEDSHESIQELQKLLWWMDDEGAALFGDTHSWLIPDFKPEETYEEMEGRLVHSNFALLWNERAKPDLHDQAREVMLEYGRQRTFYSKMTLMISRYNQAAKAELKSLPQSATYDKALTARDLALQVERASQEGALRREAFLTVIKPFFTTS